MKVDITPGKVTAWLGVPAALVSAIIAWEYVGWKTPKAHQADIAKMEVEHESFGSAILMQLQVNRDEWWCDEESETMDELLAKKDAGDDSAALEQRIMEQRAKMTDTACHRFDKD
jgi:hypothetical protein